MQIYEVDDKRKFMTLLLIADEQENMIERYLENGVMYVLDDNGIKGEILVSKISDEIIEIKNLAVLTEFQRKGYGKALVDFICERYNNYSVLQVGTGDSPLTVPFYEKCGFKRSHVVKNFFTDNYNHPIIENGVLLVDMVYLKKNLK